MKKISKITIIVISILFFNQVFGFELPKEIASGNSYFKSMDEFGQFKDYGVQVVNKSDGHPVRIGKKSLRFEIRGGDCQRNSKGWNDCELKRERHELTSASCLAASCSPAACRLRPRARRGCWAP